MLFSLYFWQPHCLVMTEFSHLTDEDTEVQSVCAACQSSHWWKVAVLWKQRPYACGFPYIRFIVALLHLAQHRAKHYQPGKQGRGDYCSPYNIMRVHFHLPLVTATIWRPRESFRRKCVSKSTRFFWEESIRSSTTDSFSLSLLVIALSQC